MSLDDALALGAAAWDALSAESHRPLPFMSWAWHRAWADAAPPDELASAEAIALFDASGGLRALFPFALRRALFHRVPVDSLTWAIGDAGCPDHLDLLAVPGTDLEPLAAALDAVPWRIMQLGNLGAGAVNARALGDRIAAHGHTMRRRALWSCPRIAIDGDWERYLGTLTPTRRQTVRRKERSLRRHFAVTLTDYTAATLDEGWRRLMMLHDRRWPGEGAFREPRLERMQRAFAGQLAAAGRLWLTTLELDGASAAAWYGFALGDTVYFYQSGRDPRFEGESVGLVLMARMIRRAIEGGYKRFDFLRGDDAYKAQWTSDHRATEEIVLFRRGLAGRGLLLLDVAAELRSRIAPRRVGDA